MFKRRKVGGLVAMVLARTTVAHEVDARALAQRLVASGLAVCVHVQPLTSTYRWKERVEVEPEWLVEARAMPGRLTNLQHAMMADHPYELPLFEVVESKVSHQYAQWAKATDGSVHR